jgi:hypothetical protein
MRLLDGEESLLERYRKDTARPAERDALHAICDALNTHPPLTADPNLQAAPQRYFAPSAAGRASRLSDIAKQNEAVRQDEIERMRAAAAVHPTRRAAALHVAAELYPAGINDPAAMKSHVNRLRQRISNKRRPTTT